MGQIKVRGKMQRVAVINDNRVVARTALYLIYRQRHHGDLT